MTRPCPCGAASPYDACCGPLHAGESTASTPEALMRSRYSAFVLRKADYLRETWHPSTRPQRLDLDPRTRWLGLQVLSASGGVFDTSGVVEFRARHDKGEHVERSHFLREGGRWYYVDGVAVR